MHDALERITTLLAELPGVGSRSAERMAMALARNGQLMRDLSAALRDADARVALCERCGNLTTKDHNPCRLCTDPRRDDSMLCVVQDPSDISKIEKSGGFRGRYFALMEKISPMRGEGVQNARIDELLKRAGESSLKEVILALDADTESDATASFLRDALASKNLRLSRLARGIPAGSGVAYSDSVTLGDALRGRQQM